LQVVVVLDCGLAPEIRVRAGAEAASGVGADVDDLVRARLLERLDVRVDGDEVDSLHLRLDHAVYGVDARTAHSDHPENGPADRGLRTRPPAQPADGPHHGDLPLRSGGTTPQAALPSCSPAWGYRPSRTSFAS